MLAYSQEEQIDWRWQRLEFNRVGRWNGHRTSFHTQIPWKETAQLKWRFGWSANWRLQSSYWCPPTKYCTNVWHFLGQKTLLYCPRIAQRGLWRLALTTLAGQMLHWESSHTDCAVDPPCTRVSTHKEHFAPRSQVQQRIGKYRQI